MMMIGTVFLTVWMLQITTDHQAIVQVATNLAKHVKSRDAKKMAECIRLVCVIKHPEWENGKPGLNRPSHELYAFRFCRCVVSFQDFAQTLKAKYNINFTGPFPRTAFPYPIDSDISPWVDAIRKCASNRCAMVNGDKCYEYRIKYSGDVMNQRFVQIQGKWYLGSLPFADMTEWDFCRNDPATYAISDLIITQIPWYHSQAKKMAEEGKSKADVIKYMQDSRMLNLLTPEAVVQTGSTLPVPSVQKP